MGCSGSKATIVELDLSWTPTELGDYILDLEEEKIKRAFEFKKSLPKSGLIDVMLRSLIFYLVYKNQRTYTDLKASDIEQQMETQRNDDKLRHDLEPIAKWMLENKIGKSQTTIQPDDYAETIGKWFDKYSEAMSGL
eukprot:615996_1